MRQQRPHAAPQYETAVRVPGGEIVHRVYAVATPSGAGAIVVDFENASRAPCSVAVFVRARAKGTVTLDGSTLAIDGRPC